MSLYDQCFIGTYFLQPHSVDDGRIRDLRGETHPRISTVERRVDETLRVYQTGSPVVRQKPLRPHVGKYPVRSTDRQGEILQREIPSGSSLQSSLSLSVLIFVEYYCTQFC